MEKCVQDFPEPLLIHGNALSAAFLQGKRARRRPRHDLIIVLAAEAQFVEQQLRERFVGCASP